MKHIPFAAALAAAAACLLFQLAVLRPGHSWMDDAFMYVMHARNLAAGAPYADTCYRFNPENPYPGPPVYPPGYPAFLAVLMKGGAGLSGFKTANAALLACLLLCLAALFPAARAAPGGTAALLLLGVSPVLTGLTGMVYSDILFCLLLYLALLAWSLAKERGGAAWFAAAGFCCYLAYAVRPLGGILPAALLAESALSRSFTRARAAAGLAFAVPAVLQAVLSGPLAYGGLMKGAAIGTFLSGAAGTLALFANSLVTFWAPDLGASAAASVLGAALALALLAAFAAGLKDRAARGELCAMDFFAPAYLAAVAAFRFYDGPRYLLPLVPYLLFTAPAGAARLAGEKAARRGAALFLCAAFALCAWNYAAAPAKAEDGPFSAPAQAMFSFLSGAASPGERVVFIKPRSLCFFTGLPASVYPARKDDAGMLDYLQKEKVRWVVVSRLFPQDAEYLYGFAQRHRDLLRNVYENSDFKVLRFSRPGAGE
jgi:hypothetical protein